MVKVLLLGKTQLVLINSSSGRDVGNRSVGSRLELSDTTGYKNGEKH